jgi:chromate reductase, NAD(P)H dehydrogenase (quinone)
MRILAIAGSLRAGSHNRGLLEAARRRAAEADMGVEIEILEPEAIRALPAFDQDAEDDPGGAVERLRRRVRAADSVLLATPEYNHSIPGALKNALDWLSRPKRDAALANKPAAVAGASTGRFGAVWAQAETRKVLGASGARVLDAELAVPLSRRAFAPDGELADPELGERLDGLVADLAELAREREALAA